LQRTGQLTDDRVLDVKVSDLLIDLRFRFRGRSLEAWSDISRRGVWDHSLVRPWPSGEPVLQQVEQAVESPVRDIHIPCIRSTLESQVTAPIGRLNADLRAEPGQRMEVLFAL
jgi:hypothetical protein